MSAPEQVTTTPTTRDNRQPPQAANAGTPNGAAPAATGDRAARLDDARRDRRGTR